MLRQLKISDEILKIPILAPNFLNIVRGLFCLNFALFDKKFLTIGLKTAQNLGKGEPAQLPQIPDADLKTINLVHILAKYFRLTIECLMATI